MFWAAARESYSNVDRVADSDYQLFLKHTREFQHDVYGGLAGWVQDMGHRWCADQTPVNGRVLEIGFGAGRHGRFFKQNRDKYFVCDYDANFAQTEAWAERSGLGIRCDARQLPIATGSLDCIISIYNLEHIDDVPGVLRECARVLRPEGRLLLALPCEGGLAWNLGRELTTRRHFMRKYGINYDKVIALEHLWDFPGLMGHLRNSSEFRVSQRDFFPTRLPNFHLNLVACLALDRK